MGPVGYFLDSLLCSKGQHNKKTLFFFFSGFLSGVSCFQSEGLGPGFTKKINC